MRELSWTVTKPFYFVALTHSICIKRSPKSNNCDNQPNHMVSRRHLYLMLCFEGGG